MPAYSKDGRHLAVGLHGDAGLTVLRTSDYTAVARDADYRDKVLGPDFRADGVLAVAALDGHVRLYDPEFRLLGRKRTAPGTQPLTVRFSPDGRHLAVSFHDVPALAVFDAADLSLAFTPDASRLVHHPASPTRVVGRRRIAVRVRRLRRTRGEPDPALAEARPRHHGTLPAAPTNGSPTCSRCPAAAWRSRRRIPRSATLDADGRPLLFRGPELAGFSAGTRDSRCRAMRPRPVRR